MRRDFSTMAIRPGSTLSEATIVCRSRFLCQSQNDVDPGNRCTTTRTDGRPNDNWRDIARKPPTRRAGDTMRRGDIGDVSSTVRSKH